MRRRFVPGLLVAAVVVAAAVFGGVAAADWRQSLSQVPVDRSPPPFPEDASLSDVAEGTVGAVVNISTTRVVRYQDRYGHMPFNDPFFDYFFGRGSGRGVPRERRTQSLGSGVIVDKSGVVLTNNHVVAQGEDIRVTLFDGREFAAEVLGLDPQSDLAVLRMKGKVENLTHLPLGDSSKLRLGETVLAIGNPFGLGNTVTMGIVSAKGRANMGIVDYEDFIQTDAAVNPGNSGGGLVNRRGELVGINTAILSRTGGYQGISFAIPSKMARDIMDGILSKGRVVRGWLGVAIQDITPELKEGMKLPTAKGVLVADVSPGSPAESAGLKRGDVVIEVDGEATGNTDSLQRIVAVKGGGKKVKMTLYRKGTKKVLTAVLGEPPRTNSSGKGSPVGEEGVLSGMEVVALAPSVREKFGISAQLKQGVVVSNVGTDTPAVSSGLRPGDVIIELNRTHVTSVEEFRNAYAKSPSRVLLLVARGGQTLYIMLQH